MPTAIVIDLSQFMGQQSVGCSPEASLASKDHVSFTPLQMVQYVISKAVRRIGREHPLESFCVVLLGETVRLVQKFTVDIETILHLMKDISCDKKVMQSEPRMIEEALSLIQAHAEEMFVTCQQCILCIGPCISQVSLSLEKNGKQEVQAPKKDHLNEKDVNILKKRLKDIRIHALICKSLDDTVTIPMTLAKSTLGLYCKILSYSEADAAVSYLCKKYYGIYRGQLYFGRLKTGFRLYPDPHLSLFSILYSLPGLPLQFPRVLSLVGFLPNDVTSCWPSLQRMVLNPERDWVLRAISSEEAIPGQMASQLGILLRECLRNEKLTGVIKLGSHAAGEWFALLKVLVRTPGSLLQSEELDLELHVLHPQIRIPWLKTPLSSLRTRRVSACTAMGPNKISSAPNTAVFSDRVLSSIDISRLTYDFRRIFRYCKRLPVSYSALIKECNLLCQTAVLYHYPLILSTLRDTLQSAQEKVNMEDQQVSQMLRHILHQIPVKAALHPIVIQEDFTASHHQSNAESLMSVSNLLNPS